MAVLCNIRHSRPHTHTQQKSAECNCRTFQSVLPCLFPMYTMYVIDGVIVCSATVEYVMTSLLF